MRLDSLVVRKNAESQSLYIFHTGGDSDHDVFAAT